MDHAVVPTDRLMVAVQNSFALVKVSGRGTFKLGPSLRRFCGTALGRGCRDVVFDMEDCTGMDSTFMGVLAGVAMWPTEGGKRIRVVVMNLSPKTHSMLAILGLDRLLECHEQDDTPAELKSRLAKALCLSGLDWGAVDDKKVSLDTMLQAHQHLVQALPENIVRFRDVLTYLDLEVKRMELET